MPELYTVVVIGTGGVGKSCVTLQFVSNTFVDFYDPTLADNYTFFDRCVRLIFHRKQLTVDSDEVMLKIYDTAGQEEFSAVRDQYIRLGDGLLVVYAIINAPSFREITMLQLKVDTLAHGVPVLLFGNKCDMADSREVTFDEGKSMAKGFDWGFLEGSAKERINIVEAFQEIVRMIRLVVVVEKNDDTGSESSKRRKRNPCVLL
eukprot:TRINITY_DN1542_c0_g1_i2.p1 TRINITY_DN1542_c0_g1~~TRINITY_DN1542_c0_g1_i2.p1  ORF type:complete len:204 (+),score=36.35 TRINITY_DN1542_c0_g1_i2:32-643(+)